MARGNQEPIINLPLGAEPIADGTGSSSDSGVEPVTQLADGTVIIDPASIGGPDAGSGGDSDPVKRGRGRPRGSGNGGTRRSSTTKGPQIDINGLEKILLSGHAMLAGIAKTPELELDAMEAKDLATAAAAVARHYDMTMTAKAMDWTNLIMTLGAVYGTRLMAVRMRRTMERGPRVASATVETPTPASAATRRVNVPGVGEIDVPIN